MSQDIVWTVQNGEVSNLKEMQFDANAKMQNGRTLLHVAADYGQLEVIEYLVDEKKADVNAVDKHNMSVLLTAIYGSEGQQKLERYKDSIKFLLAKGADKTGKAPDGKSYVDSAEEEEIKQLLV